MAITITAKSTVEHDTSVDICAKYYTYLLLLFIYLL